MTIKTSSWFIPLPADHLRVGISRGIPRRQPAGYRVFRKLAPGPWFNSVSPEEYDRLYKAQILGPLDPRTVVAELTAMGNGRTPVLLCFERPGVAGDWCHRALAAEWLAEALGPTRTGIWVRAPRPGGSSADAPSATSAGGADRLRPARVAGRLIYQATRPDPLIPER